MQLWVSGGVEVREGKPVRWIGEWRDWPLHAIACEIHPLQEVGYFVSPNADHDSQDFHIARLLGHG